MGDQQQPNVDHVTRHGLKRSAPDDDHTAQRLSKRFNLLNLDHSGKLYIAKPSDDDLHAVSSNVASQPEAFNDYMQLEDTKDKIYIHNLDEELAEVDNIPDEERLIFLPDIEKRLQGMPKRLLMSGNGTETRENQLVLYTVPTSLSIPKEKDSVRKAILESRARARQTAQASRDALLHDEDTEVQMSPGGQSPSQDEDIMDMD